MKSDVLIIGAGGAGLVAALFAHKAGAKVRVVTKEYPTRAQTSMAQGGINAALGNASEDSIEAHIANTLKSAAGIADEQAVEYLCSSAPDALAWLDSIGVPFSRTKDAKIAQRQLGGASAPRACYAQDYTGLKILHTLYDQCVAAGIEMISEHYLLELITGIGAENKPYVCGASFLDIRSGEVVAYESSSVILATGGYSRVYNKNSTNSSATTGDGIVAALRAGARVSDMEFVQFHPTALKNSSILISESARGAGGYLLNSKGERFVDELLPRDQVARAIHEQIEAGEEVFLDIRHLGEEFIEEELPQERKLAKLYENVDPVHDIMPIRPVAHYTMGGIEVDEFSSTKVTGLFAAGECANHRVHGANRLGGNSLLELIIFGRQAGENAALHAKNFFNGADVAAHVAGVNEFLDEVRSLPNERDFYTTYKELGDSFYTNVGIVREKRKLVEFSQKVEEVQRSLLSMGVGDDSKEYNTNLVEFLEFMNMLDLSEIIVRSALERDESRGAHFRSDAPEKNDTFYKAHSVAWRKDGALWSLMVE